jgi:hypothetical protein
MAKKPTTENIDALLARWKTRLKRAVNAIDKLEKQKKRLAKAQARQAKPPKPVEAPKPPKPEPLAVTIMREMAAPVEPLDTSIPPFLKRQTPDHDMVVAEQLRLEQEATKRKKSQGRIAKMKAKKSGETRKMPLTGRAALDAIRNG